VREEEEKKETHTYSRERGDNKRDTRRKKMSSEVTTRVEELGVDERDDLWDVIVNNDDVCFEYILPRLSGIDIKFLYEVNTETRALIKRSSRKDELRKAFKVSEMSSISTLEFAWENQSFWGKCLNKRNFCTKAARTNKLELLKWAREEKQCKWDTETINVAASRGNLKMMKYCVRKGCHISHVTSKYAGANGHLHILKYIHKAPMAICFLLPVRSAARNGHLHILKYLFKFKQNSNEWHFASCTNAAGNGHLDCLKFLRKTVKARWDEDAVRQAHENNHPECLQYLLDNGCPLPPDWRYQDGTLYTN